MHVNRLNQPPVNLDFRTLQFPIMAIVSIAHRLSGLLIFLGLPFGLWCLRESLLSAKHFDQVCHLFRAPVFKGVGLLLGWAFLFHVLAGLRHLSLDLGWGTSKTAARASAWALMLIFSVLVILTGIQSWF